MSELDLSRHPCFNKKAKGGCGRIHLPVAPRCNIQCSFCNRKYDCVNESRPGVTSAVLTPVQAVEYLKEVQRLEGSLTVAGIAGPGDPMANAPQTLETIARVRSEFPDLLLCLSSNGLNLPEHVTELKKLGVTHATVTVNAIDPEIGKDIYAWVRDNKIAYQGKEAASLLWSRQKEAILKLREQGILVKMNSIVLPGINEQHILDIAKTAGEMDVSLLNCIPVHPSPGARLEKMTEPDKAVIDSLRKKASVHVPQMTHCRRCRADAVGLLDRDRSLELAPVMQDIASRPVILHDSEKRPYVAVATREGMLVNQHLGHAENFQIWTRSNGDYKFLESRQAPEAGGGFQRWQKIAGLLHDCRAVLISAVGDTPRTVLEESGMVVLEMEGLIEEGLDAAYKGTDVSGLRPVKTKSCSGGIAGGCG